MPVSFLIHLSTATGIFGNNQTQNKYWLQLNILILKLVSQTKKTTFIFKWFGSSIQDLFHGWSVNLERVVYQSLLFWLIRLHRILHKPWKLLLMIQKAQLLVSPSINHSSKFIQFCSTFSNRSPLKNWHVKGSVFHFTRISLYTIYLEKQKSCKVRATTCRKKIAVR